MGTVGQYLGQKGPVIKQHDVSNEYRERYVQTFGKSPRQRWLEDGHDDETFEQWKIRIGGGKCKCGHAVHDSHGRCMESVATGMVDDRYIWGRCPCGSGDGDER